MKNYFDKTNANNSLFMVFSMVFSILTREYAYAKKCHNKKNLVPQSIELEFEN